MKKFLGFTLMLFTAFLLVACGTNEYTVTFDSNGGSEVASVVVEEGSKVDEPSEPTRLGYDFIEWQLDGDKFDFDTAITKDITLVAVWEEIVEVTIDEVTVTFTVTLPEETPDGDIYIAGSLKHENTSDWTPSADSGKAIRDGLTATYTLVYDGDDLPLEIEYKWTRGSWDTVEKDADGEELDNRKVTITKDNETFAINDRVASWADDGDDTPDPVVEYTVTFDTDGGSEISAAVVEEGETVTEPEAPTKEGHTFVEWQLDGETFDFDTSISKDITLVAVWEEDETPEPVVEHTVTFDTDGGSEISAVIVEKGETVTEPEAPTKDGFSFVEWQLEGETFDFDTAITKDITLVAVWEEDEAPEPVVEYTVTFDTDGGSEISAVIVEKGETVTEPEAPTKDGFSFVEWQLEGETFDFDTAITKDITLVAVWEEDEAPEPVVEYTVTFDTDGGSEISAVIVEKGETVTEPEAPTKDGFSFVEWQLDGETFDFDTSISKDITLVAVWEEDETPEPVVEHTVTFDTDGGSEISAVIVEKGETVTEPEAPTKDGFSFVEWQLEGETFDFDTAITKDITLVVVWEEDEAPEPVVEYTVTFDTDGGSEISAVIVEKGETVTEPEAPTKEGHTFVEWQLDGETFDFDTSISKDITLVAIWEEDETPEPSEEVTVTTVYDGETTTMDGSANNASQIGLDPTLFEVLSTARQLPNSQHVGLNANGQIRLYGHANYVGKNTLSILIAEGYVITNVIIKFSSGSDNPLSATLMLGDDEILLTAEDIVNATKTYEDLSIDGFSIRNTQNGGSGNSQIYIESIVITYKEGTATSEFAPIPVLVVTFDLNYEDSFEITRSFELNDELTMPVNPTREGFKFAGWFTDLETTTPFVSEGVVVTEELDIKPLIFTSNGAINLPLEGLNDVAITWTSSDDLLIDPETGVVTLPDVEGETIVTLTATLTLNAATDTKTFEITLVVIDSDQGEEIVLYETGFESLEEFASSTTYNNTELNIVGPEENKWGFYYGTPSTTSPINGNQSAQMRWYTSAVENLGYARTMFVAENITKVEFNAKNTNGLNVNVSYSINGTDWVGTELFELTSSPTDYTYILPTTYNGEGAYIKFEISLPASNPNGTSRLYIDDVKIYGFFDNELTDLEKLNLAGDSLFDEFNNQLYDMNTKANLPTEGLHGVTITWDYNPLDAVVDGNWKNVTEDTEVTLTATLTLGEETLDKVIEITILFVDPDASNPETLTIQLTESSIWDSKTNSYVDGNFTKDFSGLTIAATDSGIYTGGNYGDNKIQVRKNYNWIHNTTIPEGYVIKSIKVKGINSSGTIDISYSLSAVKPTTNTVTLTQEDSNFDTGDISSSDYKYFYIKGNNDLSGTITIDLIVIELIKKVDIPVEPDQNPIITLEPSLDGMVLHSVGDEFIIPTATAQDYLGNDIT